VYVGSRDGNLYALNAKMGLLKQRGLGNLEGGEAVMAPNPHPPQHGRVP